MPFLRRTSSYSTDKTARVHGSLRIQGRLDPLADRPVGSGLAPDLEWLFPFVSGSGEDQVAAIGRGGVADLADLTECLLERPIAQGVGMYNPVAGVGLSRPV